jgi:hypothetical protein
VHNHVIRTRAEEGQQKKKEAYIQTEEQRSRSFIRNKKNLRQRSQKKSRRMKRRKTSRRKRKECWGTSAAFRSRFADLNQNDRRPAAEIGMRLRLMSMRSSKIKSFTGPFRSSRTIFPSRGVRLSTPIFDYYEIYHHSSLIVPFAT